MSTNSSGAAAAHSALTTLIPWYINGTLSEADRLRLDAHLTECRQCREDLSMERRIHGGIGQHTSLEYLPGPSLKKLMGSIDGGVEPSSAPLPRAVKSGKGSRLWSWPALSAASVALVAIVVSGLALDHFLQHRNSLAPDFRTVTISTPRPREEVIRAVFAPSITLLNLQALLDEAQLRIIAGPSEAGVYSLAATSNQPVDRSLALLRGHSSVRFAESTQPRAESDRSP